MLVVDILLDIVLILFILIEIACIAVLLAYLVKDLLHKD